MASKSMSSKGLPRVMQSHYKTDGNGRKTAQPVGRVTPECVLLTVQDPCAVRKTNVPFCNNMVLPILLNLKRNVTEWFAKGCGAEGTHLPCSARRYISYGKNMVTIYHVGDHTCPVRSKPLQKDVKTVEEMVRRNPNIKASEVQSVFVVSALQQQLNWEAIEKEASSTINRKWVDNMKQKIKKDIEPFGHNFEAVVAFKEFCDKKDSFYVYKVNDRRGNPDKPSYVFKTSTQKAKMALNMDMEGEHFLSTEYCFFDGKRKRCRGFVTLTASVYHPLFRKQIPLAVMEVENENKENVQLFWNLFNEVLTKVAQKPYKFNPIGWCTDMAGAILAGISNVYGDPTRIKSCEFHFKDHRNKQARRLDSNSATEFKTLCDALLSTTTTEAYDKAKQSIDKFISSESDRSFLTTWVSWWHDRRGFIFRAFAPKDAPLMNQAEVIHAGWVHRDRPNLSLLDACQADVRDSLFTDVELKTYESGVAVGGSGPSFAEREKSKYVREMKKAKRLGEEMFPQESGMAIDPQSSHCPPKRKTTKKGNQTKQRNQTKTTAGAQSASGPVVSPSTSFPSCLNPVFQPVVPVNLPNFNFPSGPIASLVTSGWHSGMSPHRYEVVLLAPAVKKCYGCGDPFAEEYRRSPFNVILKHFDRRVTGKNNAGDLTISNDFANTYYHLSADHVKKKNPLFMGLVYISLSLHRTLDNAQRHQLDHCQLNIVIQ